MIGSGGSDTATSAGGMRLNKAATQGSSSQSSGLHMFVRCLKLTQSQTAPIFYSIFTTHEYGLNVV